MAGTLLGEVRVAKLDGTANKIINDKLGVKGFPTLKFIPENSATIESAISYEGNRDLD